MNYADKALELAIKAHKGQKDKGGADYILYPMEVASYMDTDVEKAVAYLHDIIEDTSITFGDLEKYGFPDEVLNAVSVLTRRKEENYQDYIDRISRNPIAKKVKISDLLHNMDLSRISNPTSHDQKRCEKYKRSLIYLATH